MRGEAKAAAKDAKEGEMVRSDRGTGRALMGTITEATATIRADTTRTTLAEARKAPAVGRAAGQGKAKVQVKAPASVPARAREKGRGGAASREGSACATGSTRTATAR
ncbi:MAG: hypothetical protein AB1696_20125 [Planctomycetota bacterium]